MPPIRDFIIDRRPDLSPIIVCTGAVHAYKFASLFGKILSQLAIDDQTGYPICDFTRQRPIIQDPAYQATVHS